jgi:hypothetical protein
MKASECNSSLMAKYVSGKLREETETGRIIFQEVKY